MDHYDCHVLVIEWISLDAHNRWFFNLDGTYDIITHDEGKFLVDGIQILIRNAREWEEEHMSFWDCLPFLRAAILLIPYPTY